MTDAKRNIISQLQKNIEVWEGFRPSAVDAVSSLGLGPVEAVFPNGIFPRGAVHEFLTGAPEHTAASSGFIAGLLAPLMQNGGACLWTGMARTVFPLSIKAFGIEPDRIIFIDVQKEKDVLWVMEEALKCCGLAAVIAEVRDISFMQSRRLQLAVEQSKITGFVIRKDAYKLDATACVARWKVTSLPAGTDDGLPGVGFPRWNVELLKVRNGNPGAWTVEWLAGRFNIINKEIAATILKKYA